jgi:hypothetical protein
VVRANVCDAVCGSVAREISLALTEGFGRGRGGRILRSPLGVLMIAFATFVEIVFDATDLWFLFARVATRALQVASKDRQILLSISVSTLIREDCRADACPFHPSVKIKERMTAEKAKLQRLMNPTHDAIALRRRTQ